MEALPVRYSSFYFRIRTFPDLPERARYNVTEAAKLLRCSERQLRRCCLKAFGRTAQDWLNDERLKAAAKLLCVESCIKTIALDLGFKQPSHFSRQFKLHYGMSPSQFVISGSLSGTDQKCPPQISHKSGADLNRYYANDRSQG
jgi:AraC-like DNA-binding protein